VRQLDIEIVEPNHERLGLPGLIFLEVVGRNIVYLLFETLHELLLEAAPKAKQQIQQLQSEFARAECLLKDVHEIFNLQAVQLLLHI